MGIFTDNGWITDDDPRYKEGISITISLSLNEKPEKDPKDSEKYVPQNEKPLLHNIKE